ncbi:alpha/beta hydrolase-fold protein [Foetidibacter luteolus]|uniref:alpha/beta hydrolase-fold protein n=1 Tax=Foetidibacter luteolus TaxID=2608880 RepID=UPI00129AB9C8|nr:alpha/beta hydrolase-fold protein [Foetidibacter luteolus]
MKSLKSKLILLIIFYTHTINAQVLTNEAEKTIRHGTLLSEQFASTILKENRTGLNPRRNIQVFLPPGYDTSKKLYPVLYYCHNIFWNAEKLLEDGRLVSLIETGFANGVVKEFIFVAADYSTPTTGSVYENSPVTGRWLDFTVKELVPFIDGKFRTIKSRDSRAITGDMMGARGALKLAMVNADVFSVVYALNPVAAGTGDIPWSYVSLDWKAIHQAKSFADITDGRTRLFITFNQAFLPNLNRPPFYCDFFMEMENGEPKLNVANARKMQRELLLDEILGESEKSLRTMRGIAFDWGRFDETRAHVESNRDLSRKLQDLGIEHEAEEYAGNPYDKNWIANGRFFSRVLPFLNRHLVFNEN